VVLTQLQYDSSVGVISLLWCDVVATLLWVGDEDVVDDSVVWLLLYSLT